MSRLTGKVKRIHFLYIKKFLLDAIRFALCVESNVTRFTNLILKINIVLKKVLVINFRDLVETNQKIQIKQSLIVAMI